MTSPLAMIGAALALGITISAQPADATTLTGSFAAWQAGAGGAFATTAATGLADPLALNLPTTSSVVLTDGSRIGLSTPAQVTQAQNGFPYLLADGFAGDLLIPVNAAGTQVSSETFTLPQSLGAFGFEVVPFSSNLGGPYSITVQLASGQTLSQMTPGGVFGGTSTPVFVGYYGGAVTSLVITTTDTMGLAFGNFVDSAGAAASVPEPGSLALLAMATTLLAIGMGGGRLSRRRPS